MYNVNSIPFKTKKHITHYMRDLIARNENNKSITGDDKIFIDELVKFHSEYTNKTNNMDFYFIAIDKYQKNRCLYVQYLNGKVDDISWTHCILNIPVPSDKHIDYVFRFGKYKVFSIYNIPDIPYLEWVVNNVTNLYREDKVKIKQYLKYGYIPFNYMVIKNIKNKSNYEN